MLEEAIVIQTYLPFDSEPGSHDLDLASLCEKCKTLPRLLELLHQSAPVGCLGQYAAVYELSLGVEGFTPLKGAHPAKGQAGLPESLASLCFKTYVSADTAQSVIEDFLRALVALHPWEHPCIEATRAHLVRGPDSRVSPAQGTI